MTIASLVVRLSAETAQFHADMEAVARRVEMTGRRITRAGMEISKAISLPIIGVGLGAFAAALEDSHRHFGPLFVAFETLKAKVHDLFLAIGQELLPTFLQLIAGKDGLLNWLRSLVDAFSQLPPGIKKVIINTLLFLAALGPTIVAIGGLIRAVGAVGSALSLLISPIGLVALAVMGLAAAGLYTATHWEEVKLRLTLVWAFLVDLFFQGARGVLLSLDILTLGLTKITGITDVLREKLDALADRTLGKLGGEIVALEARLAKTHETLKHTSTSSLEVRKVLNDMAEATRQLIVNQQILGPTFDGTAVQAQILGNAIHGLIAQGVSANHVLPGLGLTIKDLADMMLRGQEYSRAFSQALGAFGPRLEQQVRASARFKELIETGMAPGKAADALSREGQLMINASQAIRDGVGSAFGALGAQLGNIFAGLSHGFQGFGKLIGAVLGATLQTVGKALIAFGVAGDAIKKFITNPFAAIAAGVALIALGGALAASAASSVNASGSALAGGGGASAGAGYATSAPTGSSSGDVYVTFPTGQVFNPSDPQQQEAFREFIESLLGRKVLILPPGA